MAALYLHNAVFTPETPDTARSPPFPHSRNVSTISGTTLHASASESSHATEPLLQPITPDSLAYIDLFSRQPTLIDEAGPLEWGPHPTLLGDPPTLREKKNFWERTLRKRLKRLRILMRTLELIFGAWAIYNATRYFIAFTTYDSAQGQLVSLVLGTCAGISFALLATAVIFNFFKLHLLMYSVPLRLLTLIALSSLCLSSFALIAPAIVNIVLLFVWRGSLEQELSTEQRCNIDIDVIWSGSKQECPKPYGWGAWMALSATRLGITAILIGFYYTFLIAYERTRRPVKWISPARLHQRRRSSSQAVIPPQTAQVSSHSLATSTLHQQGSRSTMVSHSPSKKSLRPSDSSTSINGSSDSNAPRAPPIDLNSDLERETLGLVDRFRSIVSHITRETDQPVVFARSDDSSDSSSCSRPSSNDQPYDFYPPPIPPSIGYNEFGQPYPPEESVLILNGFIRRMPTIESMGSREIASTNRGSSVYSGSIMDRLAGTSNSRPPTRISLSQPGSEPPSRANSLSMRAADIIGSINGMGASSSVMGHTTEIGELIRASIDKRHSHPPSSPLVQSYNSSLPLPDGGQGVGSQSSRASTAPTTYYTATMGSLSSVPSSTDQNVHMPDP
ncbi:hypothetical protein P691DRAFT_810202 [Macrolepiota fuliginosa MF-IS2]|uniref:Uncharacterized protein n=1 Tax=Macrolepiota fuliginosa MF-IS2 TaxID=1400762 RepID=A0A9P5XJ56_9AGAR|nr:hypothetical protein P691DRAFT_810202 [Macrolepiota fuliginosa MF-IS2]